MQGEPWDKGNMKASQTDSMESMQEPTQTGHSEYSKEWKAYAGRRNLGLFFLYGAIPFSVAAYLVSQLWLNEVLIGMALILVWWAVMCVAIWWAGEFRCPRCYRRFGALGSNKGLSTFWRGLFDKVCANCKLRRWE